MTKYLYLTLLSLFCAGFSVAQEKKPADYVNTLQGTDSEPALSYGNTYPTVGLPFGIHFFSPQTGKNGDGWKYQYKATTIRGFQQTHQCSPWMNDYAVFSLMPVAGKLVVDEDDRALAFKHTNEVAKPHYYKVDFDNGIRAELSPAERGAHMKFTFPADQDAQVVLDGFLKNCDITILPTAKKIVGWVDNGRFVPKNFRNYFVISFDQAFTGYGTWENRKNTIVPARSFAMGPGAGAFVRFRKGAVVQVKVSSSYISLEQAQLNLERELGKAAKFEDTRDSAETVWNNLLGRIEVQGGSEQEKATFYSCLFRANLYSRKFYDLDKNSKPVYYSPYDGKVHQGYMYTDNGFWDTFRAQFPLSNLLHPQMQGRHMKALLAAQEESGWMPTWSNPGMSGVMLGNHAISLLADAWAKGIRDFDAGKALAAYYHEATNKGPLGGSNGREGWKEYFTLGYIAHPEVPEATAKTLEYAYDDFCAWNLARMSGNKFYESVFARQMYNYRQVFDTETGFVRGRKMNGEWQENFDPVEWGGPFAEGNAWQYTWSVFHDIQGLKELMGGNEKFLARLDSFFTRASDFKVGTYGKEIHEMKEMVLAGMGQYAHGNQPVQHVAYLYNYAGQPWKTQERVRKIMDQLYNATEKGFPGDEDQGQMSSWYVLSALGLYSVSPGTDQYVIGSPVFQKASIRLENGKTFTVDAQNNSKENVYIESAVLNGKEHTRNWLSYEEIMNGGTLELKMSASPNTTRGTAPADQPFSLTLAR
ncbi:alpha-mannosidase [Pedobacter yulinensis]|uniref:Alpha-mannosidase n=1 Tax=Pedobacter yulinensis TaxID=2126353 RepID=A0A2T3HHW0_9SPHI|nr:GH92 family glycosyl hydrolase [Pedobacter yulinensis]PST82022.1 alpha-mannosidase [Pedobacter yulinensis]